MENIDFDFNDNVVEAFSQGDCWVLARALNEISGHKMYWAGSRRGNPNFSWCHIFIMIDSDTVIDINGVQSIEKFTTKWRRIAKKWGNINHSSDFIVMPVDDIHAMTISMRPKYWESSRAYEYAHHIMERVSSHA